VIDGTCAANMCQNGRISARRKRRGTRVSPSRRAAPGLGARCGTTLPRRSVDGERAHLDRQRPARTGPVAGDGATWAHGSRRASERLAVDTICRMRRTGSRRVRRRGESTATRRASRRARCSARLAVRGPVDLPFRPTWLLQRRTSPGRHHLHLRRSGCARSSTRLLDVSTPRRQATRDALRKNARGSA
jgi:hypothetical protein